MAIIKCDNVLREHCFMRLQITHAYVICVETFADESN